MQTINPGFHRSSTTTGPAPAWRERARKALDNWGGSPEINVAVAIEGGYKDGLKKAAQFIEGKGQRELAAMVRKLAEEGQ
jgi:hypothetical protein